MGEFQSGQMGQTVNLLSLTSVVRIHLPPPIERRQSLRSIFSAHSIRRTVLAGGPEKAEPDDLHGTACGPSACCPPFHVAFAYRQDKFPVNEVTLSQEFC